MSSTLFTGFFREQHKKYSLEEIIQILNPSLSDMEPHEQKEFSDSVEDILKKLSEKRVVCIGKKNDVDLDNLNEVDDENEDSEDNQDPVEDSSEDDEIGYFFNFVGIVTVRNFVFKCYPKYIRKDRIESEADNRIIDNHFSLVLQVINHFIKDKDIQNLSLFNYAAEEVNPISFRIYLLQNYYENGLYYSQERYIGTNGEGEIDWDCTINDTVPIIKNNIPYYVEFKTNETREDQNNFVRKVHQAVLSECSDSLQQTGLLKYIGIAPVTFDYSKVLDLGRIEYIERMLEAEHRIQNQNLQKQKIEDILNYIREQYKFERKSDVQVFGTRSFDRVWEYICKAVFDDLYENTRHYFYTDIKAKWPHISTIEKAYKKKNFESSISFESLEKTKSLSSFMGRTEWSIINKNQNLEFQKYPGLKPDVMTIYDDKFLLLDAKYYAIEKNLKTNRIKRMPGAPDVSKQFFYEMIITPKAEKCGFKVVKNFFLVPKIIFDDSVEDKDSFKIECNARYSQIQNILVKHVSDLNVVSLDTEKCYRAFLKRETILKEFSESNLFTKFENENNIFSCFVYFTNEELADTPKELLIQGEPHPNLILCKKILVLKKSADEEFYDCIMADITNLTINLENPAVKVTYSNSISKQVSRPLIDKAIENSFNLYLEQDDMKVIDKDVIYADEELRGVIYS